MKQTLWLVGCVWLALGCSENQPVKPRGLLTPEGQPVKTRLELEEQPEDEEVEGDVRRVRPAPRRTLPSPFKPGPGDLMANAPSDQAGEPAPGEGEEEKRDLSAELASLLGRPVDCLDLTAAAKQPGGRTTISVSAYVMASGRITRATVSAPGQSAKANECLSARLTASSLPGPIEGGPLTVNASTTLEIAPATPAAGATNPGAGAPGAAPTPPAPAATPTNPDVAGPPDRDYGDGDRAGSDDVAGPPN